MVKEGCERNESVGLGEVIHNKRQKSESKGIKVGNMLTNKNPRFSRFLVSSNHLSKKS